MLLNCGVGEDSWESLGLQGDPASPSWRRSVLGVHWKDWWWSWNSKTLASSCEELTHLKRPWCWERLRAGGEGDDRDEMVGCYYPLDGHGFGWALGVGDGQEGLVCSGSWGHKESDTTELLNWNWTESLKKNDKRPLWLDFLLLLLLFQGILLTRGWDPCLWHLLHWQVGALPQAPPEKPSEISASCLMCPQPLSHVRLFLKPWTLNHQALLSMGFPGKNGSGLPFPSLCNLPNPGTKPEFPASPALGGRFFITEPLGKPWTETKSTCRLQVTTNNGLFLSLVE